MAASSPRSSRTGRHWAASPRLCGADRDRRRSGPGRGVRHPQLPPRRARTPRRRRRFRNDRARDLGPAAPARRPPARDPLLHFVVAGRVLFVAYDAFAPEAQQAADPMRIELTKDDMKQLALVAALAGAAPARSRPTAPARRGAGAAAHPRPRGGLLRARPRRRDRRAPAGAEDGLPARRPRRSSTRRARTNSPPGTPPIPAQFTLPRAGELPPRLLLAGRPRRCRRRRPRVAALPALAGVPTSSPALAGLGDRFMFQDYYGGRTAEEVGKEFGPDFASALFGQKPGGWVGPIRSGYGWHLVFIDSLEPARVPRFEEIEADVRAAWTDERYKEIRQRAEDDMRARYTVVIPRSTRPTSPTFGAPQAGVESRPGALSVGPRRSLACLALVLLPRPGAEAHEVRPAYLQIDQAGPDRYTVDLEARRSCPACPCRSSLDLARGRAHRQRPGPAGACRARPSSAASSRCPAGSPASGSTSSACRRRSPTSSARITIDGRTTTSMVDPSQPWLDVAGEQSALSAAVPTSASASSTSCSASTTCSSSASCADRARLAVLREDDHRIHGRAHDHAGRSRPSASPTLPPRRRSRR